MNNKTVFITGASTGIGRQTAILFHQMGWNVVASMRNKEKAGRLNELENMLVVYCDIRVKASIEGALQKAVDTFGTIDVLVNNAGCYAICPFEKMSDEKIETILDTNVMGTISVTKQVLPYMKKQQGGTVVNISSLAGVSTVPLQTIYQTSKWAVEGFTESLQHELRQFNIQMKLIEPGIVHTGIYNHTTDVFREKSLGEYRVYSLKVIRNLLNMVREGSHPREVAQVIYKASTDNSKKLRYAVGKQTKETITARKFLPFAVSTKLIRNVMEE